MPIIVIIITTVLVVTVVLVFFFNAAASRGLVVLVLVNMSLAAHHTTALGVGLLHPWPAGRHAVSSGHVVFQEVKMHQGSPLETPAPDHQRHHRCTSSYRSIVGDVQPLDLGD
jgi:hypothetical protein